MLKMRELPVIPQDATFLTRLPLLWIAHGILTMSASALGGQIPEAFSGGESLHSNKNGARRLFLSSAGVSPEGRCPESWHGISALTALRITVPVLTVVVLTLLVWLIPATRAAVLNALRNLRKEAAPSSSENQTRGNDTFGEICTYTLEELAKATLNFTTKVGEGGFGTVYRANLGADAVAAVKRATGPGMHDPQIYKDELSVLLRVRHPNLVNLIGFCFEQGERILVFEFLPKGSLYDRLHTARGEAEGPLSWADRMEIALQVAVALEYLHREAKPPIAHRDVKSSNVLLAADNRAKLADFGLSKVGVRDDDQATPTVVRGSCGYTDPEYMRTGKLSLKSDVYSFGVLLLELVTGLKSVQGTLTLPCWCENYRLSDDIQMLSSIADPQLQRQVDLAALKNIVGIANLCVLDKAECRPSMRQVVCAMRRNGRVLAIPATSDDAGESSFTSEDASNGGGVLGRESVSFLYTGIGR